MNDKKIITKRDDPSLVKTRPEMRETCFRCMKPTVMCVCPSFEPIDNKTPLIVIQHPREVRHPLGTVRLLKTGLKNVQVDVAFDLSPHGPGLQENLPEGCALLFPSDDAADIETMDPSERPKALLAIDGTWHHAKTILRETPWLHELPKVKVNPNAASRYLIRREPQENFRSTAEAVLQAMAAIEPETQGFEDILNIFDEMIAAQEKARRNSRSPRREQKKSAQRESRSIPEALLRGDKRIVIVAAEFLPIEVDGKKITEPLLIGAMTLDGKESIVMRVESNRVQPAPHHWEKWGVDPTQLPATPPSEVKERLREFISDEGVLAAWNSKTLRTLDAYLPKGHERIMLKAAYCNSTREKALPIEELPEKHGLTMPERVIGGRLGHRLCAAVAIGGFLG